MSPLVMFHEVSKSFASGMLIENVSFKLAQGEITTLIGQNGAGKTTIAKMILGLEKVTKGKVTVSKNLKIGYAPQNLDFVLNFPLTAAGLLQILAPVYEDAEMQELKNLIDFDRVRDIDVSHLSSGQLQKLLLMATLVNKPDLVILDEPTQYLDVASQQEFYRILNQLKERNGLTVFMISHDLFTVMKNSDQVICINGHVCCIGKPSEINENTDLKNALTEIGLYIHSHDHTH